MIEPKFKVGQHVYVADANWTEKQIQCPDCLGAKEWSVKTPAGENFFLPCGTCMYGYFCRGTISKWEEAPSVRLLTVGSVRTDTGDTENPVSYMMVETGVGTGSVYNEVKVFFDKDEAMAYATELSRERTIQRNIQDAERIAKDRKRHRSKPSWETRRIRELEAKVKELSREACA